MAGTGKAIKIDGESTLQPREAVMLLIRRPYLSEVLNVLLS